MADDPNAIRIDLRPLGQNRVRIRSGIRQRGEWFDANWLPDRAKIGFRSRLVRRGEIDVRIRLADRRHL